MAPTDFIRRQIAAVLGDIGADVVKTGMLPTSEVRMVACFDGMSLLSCPHIAEAWRCCCRCCYHLCHCRSPCCQC